MKTKQLVLIAAFAALALASAAALPAAEKGYDDPARLLQLIREAKEYEQQLFAPLRADRNFIKNQ